MRSIHEPLPNARLSWWLTWALALTLSTGVATWSRVASAEDAPPPPLPLAPLEKLFLPLDEKLKDLPPFLRDIDLRAHFRTYFFDRTNPSGTENEALTTGGWLSLQSGWLLDTFAVGATIYGSLRLYGPEDRDGTLLLKPGQESYFVPGEAWGALRYKEYALLKGYRQLVDQAYINPQDNRMTPNTFEGVTLGGKIDFVEYYGGYLWKIKPRNADKFISLSEQAGAPDSNNGAALAGVRIKPIKDLRIDIANQYGINTFNTVYAEANYLLPLTEGWALRLGAQFTDQRAVGDALVANASKSKWVTQVGGARVQVIWKELTLSGAFSITAAGNKIQNPWGSYPGYLSLIDQDFDRAREKAWLVGAAYNFSKLHKLTQGMEANVNFAWGVDAIDPSTRAKAPNQGEYDFTFDYRPPWIEPSFLKGLWLRARAAVLDQQDAKQVGYQFRVILNWERDLL